MKKKLLERIQVADRLVIDYTFDSLSKYARCRNLLNLLRLLTKRNTISEDYFRERTLINTFGSRVTKHSMRSNSSYALSPISYLQYHQ